jgi:hypothetical protein
MKSAEARSQATGMFHTTAIRSSDLTSVSWGWGSSGSQKKTRKSMLPSAIIAPIWRSPPSGPDWRHVTGSSSSRPSMVPLVPVATRSCAASMPRLKRAHSIRSCFLLS